MKRMVISIIVMFSLVDFTYAHEDITPFNVRYYGSFRKIIQSAMLDGVVGLEHALSAPHIYAVGEIKNAEGEITVYDGTVWLNYGEDGISKSINRIPHGEEAMQLVTAQVENWEETIIPKNMSDTELRNFMLDRANKSGLNTKIPFPFLVEGNMKDLVWHVLDGADFEPSGQGKQLLFKKLVEYREHTSALLVGFCSAEIQSEITRPGESWHVHVIFKNEKNTGHIDTFSVAKGSRLRLPIK